MLLVIITKDVSIKNYASNLSYNVPHMHCRLWGVELRMVSGLDIGGCPVARGYQSMISGNHILWQCLLAKRLWLPECFFGCLKGYHFILVNVKAWVYLSKLPSGCRIKNLL